jgi:hypothetical protein
VLVPVLYTILSSLSIYPSIHLFIPPTQGPFPSWVTDSWTAHYEEAIQKLNVAISLESAEVASTLKAALEGALHIEKNHHTGHRVWRPSGVMVLGASRSGTSVATGLLEKLGARLYAPGNEKVIEVCRGSLSLCVKREKSCNNALLTPASGQTKSPRLL